ncbi:GNAT family N-acetyltransferase [Pseudomonas sp. NCHU5208]|uniref:GNAT family N-acetyltransferase n=1 Tax=unclassified Pseudomonas TaxID=196821 RepID=UPI003F975E5C
MEALVRSRELSLLRWQSLSSFQQAVVLSLSVTAQQIEFAGTVERSVQVCQADQVDEIAGLAIIEASSVIGFLLLKRGASAPAWTGANAVAVSAMRIDLSRQGQGVGAAALWAVPGWLAEHWPGATELILSVDEENQLARNAYAKAGFVDLGKREEGRIGWVRYMARPLRGISS